MNGIWVMLIGDGDIENKTIMCCGFEVVYWEQFTRRNLLYLLPDGEWFEITNDRKHDVNRIMQDITSAIMDNKNYVVIDLKQYALDN